MKAPWRTRQPQAARTPTRVRTPDPVRLLPPRRPARTAKDRVGGWARAWTALCALAWPCAAQDGDAARTVVELPAGPLARALGADDASSPARPLPFALAALASDAGWGSPLWASWSERVRRVAASGDADQAAGAVDELWLAAWARLTNRDDDGWEHLTRAARDPAQARALLPLFAPGVEPALLAQRAAAGGVLELPDDVLLEPALPPPTDDAQPQVLGSGRTRPGRVEVRGLRIGVATVALVLSMESDGPQLVLRHVAGGACRVRVRLPEPLDFRIAAEYLDWERQSTPHDVRALELAPGGAERTLFGRLEPRGLEWPVTLPQATSAQLARQGLRLDAGSAALDLEPLAQALRAVLEIPVRTSARAASPGRDDAPGTPDGAASVHVDLADPASRARKLAGLVSLAERWVRRAR